MVNASVPEGAKFTDTTYSLMKPATTSAAGTAGLVPPPGKGKQNAFLKEDGTWEEINEATEQEIDAIVAGTFKQGGN